MLWSWILSALGLVSLWYIARMNRTGFLIGLVVQVLWLFYTIETEQWGFMPTVFIYSMVYVDAYRKWGPKIAHWEEVEERDEAVHDALVELADENEPAIAEIAQEVVEEYWPEDYGHEDTDSTGDRLGTLD